MNTQRRYLVMAAVVAVAAVGIVVVAGLAGAGEPAGTGPVEPAPPTVIAGAIEPAWVRPATSAAGATEPGSVPPSAALVPALPEPVPSPRPAPPSGGGDPNGSVSSPVLPVDPGYWTPERMASAKPMPMPTPG